MALKKIMYPGQVNSRETITTSALNATDTSLTVLDGGLLPDAPNLLVLGAGSTAETVLMTSKTGNTLTIQRGFQGFPKTWALGTVIARNYTEYDYAAMLENITDLEGRLVTTDAKVVENTSAIGQITLQKSENKVTVFNANGSITETIKNGATTLSTKTTTFPSATQIVETTVENGVTTTKTTTFNADGTIKEEVV